MNAEGRGFFRLFGNLRNAPIACGQRGARFTLHTQAKALATPHSGFYGPSTSRFLDNQKLFSLALAFLLPLFVVIPALAYPIENYAVDAAYHIYRAVVFAAGQAEGYLYPRWVPAINGGLGGPIFLFYSPALYAGMVLLHYIGIPFVFTWRLSVALTFLTASVGMFGLGLALFRRSDVALAGTALYVYSPYLIRELFERGSPQAMSIALYPWVLLALLILIKRPSGLWLTLASVAWAILILTHNVGALMVLPVLVIWVGFLFLQKGHRSLILVILALFIGLLLVAFYLIPFFVERQAVQLEKAASVWASPIVDAAPLSEFFVWPVVFDTGRGDNGTGRTLGIFPLLVFPLAGAATLFLRGRRCERILIGSLIFWGVGSLWLQTPSATPVWVVATRLGIMQYLNFRWRLLAPIPLMTAISIGFLLTLSPQRYIGRLAAGITGLALVTTFPLLYPSLLPYYGYYGDVPLEPSLQDVLTFTLRSGHSDLSGFSELFTRWRLFPFTSEEAERIAASPLSNLPEGGQIFQWKRQTGVLWVEFETPVAFCAAFYALYFPGWVGYLDGEPKPLRPYEGSGYMLMDIPAGRHTVLLRYDGTKDQCIGDWISGITVLVLIILIIAWRDSTKGGLTWKVRLPIVYPKPRWWVLGFLIGSVAIKTFWLDPYTPFLRYHSTCESIRGAQAHVDVWFGDMIHLCGYAISSRHIVIPGERITLTLYWEIPRRLDRPANSFVHLVGPFNPATGNPLWGQEDKQMIINWWWPGKLYRDVYTFRVFPNAPSGEYFIEIGWWDQDTGERYSPHILRGEGIALSEWNSLLLYAISIP